MTKISRKKPDVKKIKFEETHCFLCGPDVPIEKLFRAPDRLSGIPGCFSLVRCKKCGLVFQNPRPKEECARYLYPDTLGYFQPRDSQLLSLFKPTIENIILINYYGYRNLGKPNIIYKILTLPLYLAIYRPLSIPKYVENGTLLEIGCSHGSKLQWMKQIGWKTFGVEPNKNAVGYARKKRGLNVRLGTIESVNFKANSFDVIILDMVMEHLYHPEIAISKVAKWLKKDGQLIFSIPYFEGLEFKSFGKYCYALHLPHHMYFYNKNSIRQLLKRNFSSPKFVFQWFSQDIIASAKYERAENNHPRLFSKIIAKNPLKIVFIVRIMLFFYSLFKPTSRVTVSSKKVAE